MNISITCPQKTVNEVWAARAVEIPDKTFLIFHEEKYSYKQFFELAGRFADALKARGFGPDSNLAILVPNSPDFLVAYFGAMFAGGSAATLNTLLKAEELEFVLNDCKAKILITTPHYKKMLQPVWDRLEGLELTILCRDTETPPSPTLGVGGTVDATAKGEISLASFVAGRKPYLASVESAARCEIIYTSGTTGHPKGVMLNHANIVYNSWVAPQYIDLRAEDIGLCIMPLFHVNAQIASTMATVQVGATMVLEEMFKPRTFIKTLKRYKCTTFSGVPTIYKFLNDMKEADGEDLSFLKACICGAAPMPVDVFQTFERKFNAKIIEGYGLSEGTCVSSLNPLDGVRKIGSIGIPLDGQGMAIWDEAGNPLPDGEIGEIVIQGPNVMAGYYNNPTATEAALGGGWLRTGDQGYRDQDGYYFISGRKKEMIIRGGENIYPKEIEEVLYKHESIAECAVVGVPDKKYGEEVAAFIVPKPGSSLTEKEVMNFLRPLIADFKRPRIVELVTDLPKTATGKIQKVKLVEEYAGDKKSIGWVKGKVLLPYKWVFGQAVTKYYQGLIEKKFYGVRCPKCKKVQAPPKGYCGVCYVACDEWIELPNDGVLESYTTVHMEFPGQPTKPPYTFGYVKLKGAHTHLYHLIGQGDMDDKVKVGSRVRAVWAPDGERKGSLHDIAYFEVVA